MADKVIKTTYDISYNQDNPNVNKLIKETFEDITQKDIKVGFIDPNKGYVIDVSICEANDYAKKNPATKFIFRDGDNNINYISINEVNNLTPDDLKPKDECEGFQVPKKCNVPPRIQILGGGGVGAAANPVIGTDGSLLAIDLVHGGYGYQYAPQISINDLCKIGSGAVATATLGSIVDAEETYENEIEDYEICEPNDPGYGNIYGPNGEDLGAWDPDIYINSGKGSIVAEIQKYQQNLLKYKNPFWTTRKFKPSSIVSSDKKNYVQAYSVDYPAAWNEFMNEYAISPVSPSNVSGSDNAGKLFIMQWDVEFPYDGEYIFRGLCDNFAKLYIDNLPVADLAAFNDAVLPLQKTIKKGIRKVRVDLLNAPIKEIVTKITPNTTTTTLSPIKNVSVFNTIDYISKANRTLWRINPSAGAGSGFLNQYGILPFDPNSNDAQSESYAGTHTIIWSNINFPADGEYIVRIAVDDNVTLYIGNTRIRKEGFFPGTSTGTGDLNEPYYFKAGNYTIRAELEQISGTALSRGNPMTLAIDIQTSYITQEVVSAKSWNQNPMGVSLTIDAPEPPVPQENLPVQEGRCPPNPFWTTRAPNSFKKWYPVRYTTNNAWSKFMNEYAISPTKPLDTPGSDKAGITYTNSWEIEIPYDGKYGVRGTVDNTGRILIDGKEVHILEGFNIASPKTTKVDLKKGKHNISVEVYNAPIGTSNIIDKKIFSTKDWQAPPASTVGITTQTIPVSGVELIDMLRFYTPDFGPPGPPALATHFYTSDPNNEFIRENQFVLEGLAFKLFKDTSNVPGTVDVYRLFKGIIGDHFFTTDGAEKNFAAAGGYSYEGIVGKAYSQPGPDRVEVVRYFKPSTGEHFYTTSVEEMKNLADAGYVREGTVFYAPTAVPTTTITTKTSPIPVIGTYGSGTKKDGVIYSGPELFHTTIKGYGPFINEYSVSPKVFDNISEPDNRVPGTRVMKWSNVNFPEDGTYTIELESDDDATVKIGGREVAKTTLGKPKILLVGSAISANITKGKYDIEITLTNIDTGGPQIFTQNPTAVALHITKMIDVGTVNQQTWYSNPMGVSAVLIPPPCPRKITGRGVISKIVVTDPGNDYNPPPGGPGAPGYPATLQLSEIQVINGGINYNCGVDKIKIIPDNGTIVSYTCDAFGVITGVNVNQPGIGFVDYPTIYMETETGINFSAVPIFTVVRDPIGIATDKLIQVTDLVGLKQTGYVDGRPYYGSVFYENGVKYAGNYKTIGTPIPVYNTLQESITAKITTPPSAIERFGTDVTSNDPRLNIPGTPQDTTGP